MTTEPVHFPDDPFGPMRTKPITVTDAMIKQRQMARRARCRISAWRLTELEAWRLADEIRWMQPLPAYSTCGALVDAMKRGEILMFGVPVNVR